MRRKNYSLRAKLLFALAFASTGFLSAQNEPEPCGTEVPEGFYEEMQIRMKDIREHGKGKAMSASTLPVQFIICRNNDGSSPALSSAQKTNVMNEINGAYASMNIAFYEAASELYIDNSTWNSSFNKSDDYLLPAYEVANVINIFVFKTIMSGSSSICGYAKFPNGGVNDNRIIIQTSCSQNGSTTAHELGHYFSIFHTHQGGNELVNGSNCTYAGDLFCDTPADPNISGDVNTSCIYTGTDTDANGDPYAPDPNNIMSYSRKSCRTDWSTEQENAIVASLNTDRSYLLDGAIVSTFPYSEGFESGFGGWTNQSGDDIDWTRDANGTTSSSTGPSSGQASTYYLYTESSGNGSGYPGKVADLVSPEIDLGALNNPVLEFGYHMYGSSMGTMEVSVSTNGGTSWTSVWSETGDQGNNWFTAEVSLADYFGEQILIRYRGTTGSSYRSDMAIDNVSVRESDDNTSVINTFPYIEGFETGLGVWTNGSSDDFNWSRNSGTTPSSSTGPSDAQSGTYYLYTESSGSNHPSKVADFISPSVYLTTLTNSELQFGYHMYGSAMGTLRVYVSTNGGSSWVQEWSQIGNQGNSWNTATVDISAYDGQTILIRFEGTTGSSYTSDISIDNIRIDGTGGLDEEVINLNLLRQNVSGISLYPNPVKGNTVNLEVDNYSGAVSGILRIVGIDGKAVYQKELQLQEGSNEFQVDVSALSHQLYQVVIILDDREVLSTPMLR